LLDVALLGQKKFADAEPLLLSGYKGMKAPEAALDESGRRRKKKAGERVLRRDEEWRKPDLAANWHERLKREAEAKR
jgi:hypothetical protein